MSMETDTVTAPATGTPPGVVSPFGGGGFAALRRASEDAAKAEAEHARSVEISGENPYANMTPKERKAAERAARRLKGAFEDYPHLVAMKPREGYVFRSDYFNVDGGTACILGFFHDEAARDDFGAFWGIGRIPAGLGDGVSVTVFEQVRRMGEKWIQDRINVAEKLDKLEAGEAAESGTSTSRRKAAKVSDDLSTVTAEIQDGASYLHVQNRLLVKAPSLAGLDTAVERIARLYVDRFGTLKVAAYPGEQRPELSGLFKRNDKKRGKGQHFTSVEFAGSHSLVTNGLNDPTGEFVGTMLGDVNSSAVLFDVNDYQRHVVIADSAVHTGLNRAHYPDIWGSKISQSAMLNNGRVVHLVLDGANLDHLGPKFVDLTARLDMSNGDINMFEMFGEHEDELNIFPAHLDKIVLMADQVYEFGPHEKALLSGALRETLTTFYIDNRMWLRNAQEHRNKLRIVGLPHTQIPRLQDLVSYFDTQYKALKNSGGKDATLMESYKKLGFLFTGLLDTNGDLFNTYTKDAIDGVHGARRVLYDFSEVMRRGKGVAMAQLVNTVGFAVGNLGLGDTVIIHGAEHIDSRVKAYITTQFERLNARGGRVAYLYNDVDKMLADAAFNQFDKADWTILGAMTESTVIKYQKQLAQDIPADLERLVTSKGQHLAYLRRGVTNVVFSLNLSLGLSPSRAARRAEIEEERARRDSLLSRAFPGHQPLAQPQRPATTAPVMRPRSLPLNGQPAPAEPRVQMAPTR